MRNLSRPFLAPTLAAVLLGFASSPLNAARRIAGSPYDGTWSVAIYTLRGDCGSVRATVRIVVAAFIPRTKATKRVAASALTAQFEWPSPVLADPQRAPAGCRAIPAEEVGDHLEENAPAVGQPRAAHPREKSER